MAIGVPNLTIAFHRAAETVTTRLKNGVVALILRDAGAKTGLYALGSSDDMPSGLGTANQAYVERAFLGGINTPQKVLVSIIGAEDDLVEVGAAALASSDFDYLAGPPDITEAECKALTAWLLAAREAYSIGKAVLPNYAADSMAVINFTASGIQVGSETYTTGAYCSRIAGILAGTPISASATYTALSEVTGVDTVADPGAAVDAGKLILLYDGRKAKIARGVNSLQTITSDQTEALKKIKVVEAVDLIWQNGKAVVEDSYMGQRANSYDNKLLLVTALHSYLLELEAEGVLSVGSSYAEIDQDKQRSWLKEQGVDVAEMTDQEILKADTDTWVFIKLGGTILDAMEDFDLGYWMGGNG